MQGWCHKWIQMSNDATLMYKWRLSNVKTWSKSWMMLLLHHYFFYNIIWPLLWSFENFNLGMITMEQDGTTQIPFSHTMVFEEICARGKPPFPKWHLRDIERSIGQTNMMRACHTIIMQVSQSEVKLHEKSWNGRFLAGNHMSLLIFLNALLRVPTFCLTHTHFSKPWLPKQLPSSQHLRHVPGAAQQW